MDKVAVPSTASVDGWMARDTFAAHLPRGDRLDRQLRNDAKVAGRRSSMAKTLLSYRIFGVNRLGSLHTLRCMRLADSRARQQLSRTLFWAAKRYVMEPASARVGALEL